MATGKQAYFCGKPNPLMMRMGLKMLHCHSAEAVMVGDRMDTDVISGMESGMSTVLAFLALCISLSTVFMKQHSILDVLCALPVCALGWWLCYGRPGRYG